jgi:hypothetical protein
MGGANYWDEAALRARVADASTRTRHPAGSPDVAERETYGRLLGRELARAGLHPTTAQVAVLGMTPEIRQQLHSMGCSVTCVDSSSRAVDMYRDWIDANYQGRERIVVREWSAFASSDHRPVDAFLGDGVLANVPSGAACEALLRALYAALSERGCCILRLSSLPSEYAHLPPLAEDLIRRHRAGELDRWEFGFAMRKLGFLDRAYDRASGLLDNSRVYSLVERMREAAQLSHDEYAAIGQYLFTGPNLFLPATRLEALIQDCGFSLETSTLTGRHWYGYYSFYVCQKGASCGTTSDRR